SHHCYLRVELLAMPTVRGWFVAANGGLLYLAGSFMEASPLEQVGVALLALVALSIAVVRLGKHDLAVDRKVTPSRSRPGQQVSVEIEVTNRGRGTAPLLLLEDRLPAGLSGNARLAVRGIETSGVRKTTLRLRAARRGRYQVGPLDIALVDPFGLSQMRSRAQEVADFLVHPRIEPLSMPTDRGDRRTTAVSSMRQPTGARGEDFYTLREYVEGDDLRKIHWPSTAKRNRFMIRQEETPWQTRATILLDDRRSAHDGVGDHSSFERAVEAAASMVDLYHRAGYGYRLVAAHNPGLASAKGPDHYNRCLDLLATLETTHGGGERGGRLDDALLGRLTEVEQTSSGEAALVLISGTLSPPEAVALTYAARRFRQVTAVLLPGHRFSTQATKARWEGERRLLEVQRLVTRAGARSLVLGPDESLLNGWEMLSQARPREARWGRRPELV
ncbi:MAG: DUF58 domain-containing protein, partial [Actinomycetota bacterium]